MTIALRGPRLGRWFILALGTAVLVPSACFLDSSGLGTTSESASSSASASASASSSGGGGSDAGTGGGTGSGGQPGPDGGDAGDSGDANLCGDGVVDPGEDCDGANLGSQTCLSLHHTGGSLACGPSCKLDVSGCFDYPPDWYDVAWHHRRTVTIHHAQAADLTDFPVVLTVSDPAIIGKLQASGADVLITGGDGKAKLSHEIERFNPATNELVVWVHVPAISSTVDTTLYLYYGNATCSSQENAVGVWDASDQGVWHLGETTAGMTGTVHHDSTGKAHEGTQQGNSSVAGKLGQGQSFDGSSNYIDITNPGGVVIDTADCTISAWIKTSTAAPMGAGIVSKAMGDVGVPASNKVLGVVSNSKLGFQSNNAGSYSLSGPAVNDGGWHHVVWTQTASTATWDFYVDGVHDHINTPALTADTAGLTLRFGSRVTGAGYGGAFFNGVIDEVRISSTPRSAGWIVTSFHNQGSPGTFSTLGAEQGMLMP